MEKDPFIDDVPIKSDDFPYSHVKQPKGNRFKNNVPFRLGHFAPAVSKLEFLLQDLADELRDLRHRSEENLKENRRDR